MNMVVLIGRLVRDPSYSEVETEKGKYHIASFYLAVPRNFNKGVNYIKITTFGKQADFARDYLTKGKRVAMLGELMIGSYKDKGRPVESKISAGFIYEIKSEHVRKKR